MFNHGLQELQTHNMEFIESRMSNLNTVQN